MGVDGPLPPATIRQPSASPSAMRLVGRAGALAAIRSISPFDRGMASGCEWWRLRDSNPPPPACKAGALSTSADSRHMQAIARLPKSVEAYLLSSSRRTRDKWSSKGADGPTLPRDLMRVNDVRAAIVESDTFGKRSEVHVEMEPLCRIEVFTGEDRRVALHHGETRMAREVHRDPISDARLSKQRDERVSQAVRCDV